MIVCCTHNIHNLLTMNETELQRYEYDLDYIEDYDTTREYQPYDYELDTSDEWSSLTPLSRGLFFLLRKLI